MAAAGPAATTRRIPAGYTYLGQFIDHDITFDPTSSLQRSNDPDALAELPHAALRPGLASTARARATSRTCTTGSDRARAASSCSSGARRRRTRADDLPRNAQGRALIGDPRNDENIIVSQLHLLFIRFHNAVVDHVRGEPELAGAELLREAQRIVRWHYQWIVVHDFLPRIVGDGRTSDLTLPAGEPDRVLPLAREPFIPVEFSAAAYRFGHSMVRGYLRAQRSIGHGVPIFGRRPDPRPDDHTSAASGACRALDGRLADFFDFGRDAPAAQPRAIDTKLARRCSSCAAGSIATHAAAARGSTCGAAGAGAARRARRVARAMGVTPLTAAELDLAQAADRPALLEAHAAVVLHPVRGRASTARGDRLGPVGGRIVAEVLVGLLAGDPQSYLRERPPWRPELCGTTAGDFTISDLVEFAQRKE